MQVLVVPASQVVDDGDCLAHEVHHVLRVCPTDVVLSENGADALSEHKSNVRDSVLVPKDGADFCCGVTSFSEIENEFCNGFCIGV